MPTTFRAGVLSLFLLLIHVFFNLCIATGAWAYTELRGRVIEAGSGEGVPAVDVVETLSGRFTHTDAEGRFVLRLPSTDRGRLYLSRVGYADAVFPVRSLDLMGDVVLELAAQPVATEEILYTVSPKQGPGGEIIPQRELHRAMPRDVAELFQGQPGYGVVKKGVYGSDPVIRGFKRDQLAVRIDGLAVTDPACPNRMDPVTAQVQVEDLRRVRVQKGPYNVAAAQSLGGAITLELQRPDITGDGFHVGAFTGYESNGDGVKGRLQASYGGRGWGLFLSGGRKVFDAYTDGDGNTVPSAFHISDYTARFALQPHAKHRIDLTWRQSWGRDIDYVGLPMDARRDDSRLWMVQWEGRGLLPRVLLLSGGVYGGFVDHVMDNRGRPNHVLVDAVASVDATTLGGKLEARLDAGLDTPLTLGVTVDRLEKNGVRDRIVSVNPCNGQRFTPPRSFQDAIWQASHQTTLGVYGTWSRRPAREWTLTPALRWDLNTAGAEEPAPQMLAEYGAIDETTLHGLGGALTLRWRPEEAWSAHLALGRGARFPSLTERYINHLTVGMDGYEYFGAPSLDPEVNHQAELGVEWDTEHSRVALTGFGSMVENYISAAVDTTLPRQFLPCIPPAYARRFVNLDRAGLWGAEASWSVAVTRLVSWRSSVAWTLGENLETNAPLPEIPPLEARWAVTLQPAKGALQATVSGRHAAAQDRVAPSFGETTTAPFHVFDVDASWRMKPGSERSRQAPVEVIVAVRNLTDATYVEHLSRAVKNRSAGISYAERGRNVTVHLRVWY